MKVLLWMLPPVSTELPRIVSSRPSFCGGLLVASFLSVVPDMVKDDMFVLLLSTTTALCGGLSTRSFVKSTAPLTFARSTPSSVTTPLGLSLTLLRLSAKPPVMPVPLMPSVPELLTFM